MTTKAAEYRQLATDAREQAAWISMSDARAHLLETAQLLDGLADAEDARVHREAERQRFWVRLARAGGRGVP